MQDLNWNDLRYVLALSRGRKIAAAARLLGVDQTTVSRRLNALHKTTGQRIYQRRADGMLELTKSGAELATVAERMERDIQALGGDTGRTDHAVAGVVRLTSVPLVTNRLLAPATNDLFVRHPELQLELVADSRDFSLTSREADMAVRLARPKTGGTRVKARRIGTLHYRPYAAAHHAPRNIPALPWVEYDDQMSDLPQARWMAANARAEPTAPSRLKVSDIETALEAVAAGHGRSLFPRQIGDKDERLRASAAPSESALLARDVWLLVHGELHNLPRTKAVADWLGDIFAPA